MSVSYVSTEFFEEKRRLLLLFGQDIETPWEAKYI